MDMFSGILRKVMGRNKAIDDAIGDDEKAMLEGTLDELSKSLEGAMEGIDPDQRDALMAQFEDGLAETFAELGPQIKQGNDELLDQARNLLAKWRRRVALTGQEVSFDVLNDFTAERDAVEAEGKSYKKVDKEMKRLLKQDEKSRTLLIKALEQTDDADLLQTIRALLDDGADPNQRSFLMDAPLAYAYERHRFDAMQMLVEAGADPDAVGWGPLQVAIAWGTIEDVEAALPSDLLMRPDEEKNTAAELAALVGDAEKTKLVMAAQLEASGADGAEAGDALHTAIESGDVEVVAALLGADVSVDAENQWGQSPVWTAANMHHIDVLGLLLQHDPDMSDVDDIAAYQDDPAAKLTDDGTPEVVVVARMLVEAGWDPAQLDSLNADQMRFVTGACLIPEQTVTAEDFNSQSVPRYGSGNPEKVDHPFLREMIRTGKSGYAGLQDYGPEEDKKAFPRPATWSFDRFGRTTTRLPDGRWVQIAGEHEDSYDPDFNIYNDVVVHDGMGGVEVFTYPDKAFPPTDFHTATLLEDSILIIGSLGYQQDRRVGETQVLRLNLSDFSISKVETTGDAPGWISRHEAVLEDDRIVVSGGKIQTARDYEDFNGRYALYLGDMRWEDLSTG